MRLTLHPPFPTLPLREPASGLTHLPGVILAPLGLAVLLSNAGGDPAQIAAFSVYGIGLLLLFLASSLYHLLPLSPRGTALLRQLDHAAIYLLIAATYTPFCVLAFRGFWQWGFLAIIWALAVVGIGVKVFTIHAPRGLTAGIYVVMGWLSLFAAGEMRAVLPGAVVAWLVTGGVIYTLGALVYSTRKLNLKPGVFGFHEVWHLFVLLGAAAHWAAVYLLSRA